VRAHDYALPMTLTIDRARVVIAAAEAKAREIGVPVVVAILDAGVHLKAFARMDGAPLGSIDIAMKKARTAALFGIDSEAVWEYCKPGAPAHGLEHTNGGLAPFGGGIPLSAGGQVVGAVGVSGGAVPQDLEIAQAAAAAFAGESERV
jgi:uncharacterized protein GlcG (DUF336 family)